MTHRIQVKHVSSPPQKKKVEVHLAIKLVHRHSTFHNLKESQLAGGRPVGYIQTQPRSWAKDYLQQIKLVVRAELELGICRFQVQHPNHSPFLCASN